MKRLRGFAVSHIVKAKFHYAILVADRSEASRRLVADLLARAGSLLVIGQISARCRSATSLGPVCDQDSVMEFDFYALLRRIHRVAWSVGLSVALSVCHTSESCKNGWNDQAAICVPDSGGPMNHVLHEVQMPTMEGAILRGKQASHCKV